MKKWYCCLIIIPLFLTGCMTTRNYTDIPEGATRSKIVFRSQPSSAYIYVDNHYLGKTPIKTNLWFTKEKMVNIKAIPMYESQYPQNVYLKIPPIPNKMTIYLDLQFLSKQGYSSIEEDAEVDNENYPVTVIKEVIVQTDTLWNPIVLPIIFFDTDKYNAGDLHEVELGKIEGLIKILEENPGYTLKLIGSADERGTSEYNRELALNRVNTVFNELINLGMEPERMKIIVRGEQVLTDELGQPLPYEMKRSVQFELEVK